MPNGNSSAEHPTMIIPKGTEIRVGTSGQLSIKTPGNLVIQNSGQYSEIESVTGSIRIEENVSVEAVHVKAAEACYVLGSLTAWKVEARKLTLDEKARAFIMLQESQDLELAKTARLVGNFSSEKEVFLMMSRFSAQMKSLPLQVSPGDSPGPSAPSLRPPELVHTIPPTVPPAPRLTPQAAQAPGFVGSAPPPQAMTAAEGLRMALILLDRDVRRPTYDAESRAALQRIFDAVRENNLARLRSSIDDDFSAVVEASDDARRARDLIIGALRAS